LTARENQSVVRAVGMFGVSSFFVFGVLGFILGEGKGRGGKGREGEGERGKGGWVEVEVRGGMGMGWDKNHLPTRYPTSDSTTTRKSRNYTHPSIHPSTHTSHPPTLPRLLITNQSLIPHPRPRHVVVSQYATQKRTEKNDTDIFVLMIDRRRVPSQQLRRGVE